MYTPAILLPLLLSTASALRITSIKSSGPACPASSPETVTSAGTLSDLAASIPDFVANLDASRGQDRTTDCAIAIAFDKGEVGKSLVLESVRVWAGLTLEAGGAASLITTVFWSTHPNDAVSSRKETSSTRAYADNVSVNSNFDLASGCVADDGDVGILTVNFRVLANTGLVTVGHETVGKEELPVTEHLGFKWVDC